MFDVKFLCTFDQINGAKDIDIRIEQRLDNRAAHVHLGSMVADIVRSFRFEDISDLRIADVNILGSINLIECAKEFNVKHFVYISSGGAAYGEPERVPCVETDPINPICQYGASKHTVEHYLYMYHFNYGMNYTVLRYPNVFGPRQDPHGEAGVVAIFTGKMLLGEPVTINGDGEQTRDYVFVGECAYANYLAVTIDHPSGVYNLGWGRPTSVNQIFTNLAVITEYKLPANYGPAKVGETRHIYLDASKAKKGLGWAPTKTLEEGLRETVEYFKASEKAM